jgi:hypothetical protein
MRHYTPCGQPFSRKNSEKKVGRKGFKAFGRVVKDKSN